jgi:ABC-2 type transport system ATP-binding protein
MAIEAEPAARARALTKRYANGVVALDQLELDIGRAGITALIGNNGSGKTTFLKTLAGLLTPDSGSVKVLGCDPARRTPWLRARLGYISQSVELDPEMTTWETLRLFGILYGAPHAMCHAGVAAMAESFGLTAHLPRLVSTLSGGLRQRLHLALGVLHKPELLLLDEPTAALDPPGRAVVWQFLRRLGNEGRTTVVVSHDLADVSQYCRAIAVLHKGRLLASGSPADVIAAHANWRLEVESAEPVDQNTAGFQQLASTSGVKRVIARERQLLADLAERDFGVVRRAADAILQHLARLHIAVFGYRLLPPDLANAYFNLTGASIEEAEQSGRVDSDKAAGGRRRQGQGSMV